ncbi:hypothetical protein ACMAZD_04100 [Vibrio sp. nBUS_14]
MFNAYQVEIKVTLPMPEFHWWHFGVGVASINIETDVQHLPN